MLLDIFSARLRPSAGNTLPVLIAVVWASLVAPFAHADGPTTRLVFTLEKRARGAIDEQPKILASREITREEAVRRAVVFVPALSEKLGKSGPASITDAELRTAIEKFNELGGSAAMMRAVANWAERIVVTEVPVQTVTP
jgi:hypothetical protein